MQAQQLERGGGDGWRGVRGRGESEDTSVRRLFEGQPYLEGPDVEPLPESVDWVLAQELMEGGLYRE